MPQRICSCDDNQPFIFVSYAHKDSDRVFPIIKQMQMRGYSLWFDEGIDPGSEWDENIAMHVENCTCMLAIISEAYIISENCRDELNYARDLNKERLLIYIEDVELPRGMAMRLNRLQAVHQYIYNRQEDFYRKLESSSVLKGLSIAAPDDTVRQTSCARSLRSPLTEFESMTRPQDIDCRGVRLFDGAFELEKLLGYGANAYVYLAHSGLSGNSMPVALKLLGYPSHSPLLKSNDLMELLRSKRPACIPGIYGAACLEYDTELPNGIHPWFCNGYIVTEYIDGETISSLCEKKTLTEHQALELILMMCNALSELHAIGLRYGDLSPDNVMFSNGRVYLVDSSCIDHNGSCANFITRRRNEIDEQDTVFTSPEFTHGQACDASADIFSLGMMVQYLFFEKSSTAASLNPAQRKNLQYVINSATQKDPVKRYQDVAEFRLQLQTALLTDEYPWHFFAMQEAPNAAAAVANIQIPEAAIGVRLFEDRYELQSTGRPCAGGITYTVRHVKYGFTLSLTLYGRQAAERVQIISEQYVLQLLKDSIPSCMPPVYENEVFFDDYLPECVIAPEGCAAFVVTACAAGMPLRAITNNLCAKDAVKYTRMLLEMLMELHTAGLCCGVLSDSHILVNGNRLQLSDPSFVGLDASRKHPFSARKKLIPSDGWSSPEAVCGRYVDSRSDVYVMGLAMRELLFQKSPAGTELQFFKRLKLQNIIKTATQSDPKKRFISVHELSKLLNDIFPVETEEPFL